MEGGPTIGVSSIEYATKDNGIATIDKSSGRISAISPGNTVRMILYCTYMKHFV